MMLTTGLKPKNVDGQQSGQGNVNIVLCSRERQIPFYALEESREIMYTNFWFQISDSWSVLWNSLGQKISQIGGEHFKNIPCKSKLCSLLANYRIISNFWESITFYILQCFYSYQIRKQKQTSHFLSSFSSIRPSRRFIFSGQSSKSPPI